MITLTEKLTGFCPQTLLPSLRPFATDSFSCLFFNLHHFSHLGNTVLTVWPVESRGGTLLNSGAGLGGSSWK